MFINKERLKVNKLNACLSLLMVFGMGVVFAGKTDRNSGDNPNERRDAAVARREKMMTPTDPGKITKSKRKKAAVVAVAVVETVSAKTTKVTK